MPQLLLGELHTRAPTFSQRRIWSWCRPKKEDWLKKKERNQRRPGCRRNCCNVRWAPALGPNIAVGCWWAPVLGPTPLVVKCVISCRAWFGYAGVSPGIFQQSQPSLSWIQDWLKKKDRNQRRPGRRRNLGSRWAPALGPAASSWWRLSSPWTTFTRSRSTSRSMGVQGQFLRYRATLNKLNRFSEFELEF